MRRPLGLRRTVTRDEHGEFGAAVGADPMRRARERRVEEYDGRGSPTR